MSKKEMAPAVRQAQTITSPDIEIEQKAAINLIKRSKICMLGTMDEDGFINIKAMLNLKQRGLKRVWFSTNTSSKKVGNIRKNNRVCLYYVDDKNFEGLMLCGTMQVLQDFKSRKMLWSEGAEVYYPLGIADPDYSVLSFTAIKANYYHGLKNITFEI